MMDEMVPIVLFLSLAWAVVAITRIVSESRLKRKVLEQGASGVTLEALLTSRGDPNLHASLKWGLVIAGVGIALMVLQALPYTHEDPLTFGLVLFGAGAGLLAYYGLARRREEPRPAERDGIAPAL